MKHEIPITDFGALNSIAKDILLYSATKDIKNLYKYLLQELDVLERENAIDANNKAFFRGRILSIGNDALRNLETEINKFEISFKLNNNIDTDTK